MAIAYVYEFDVGDDRSTINYDAFKEQLDKRPPPTGLILHTAGFDESGVFRIFDVWESREDQERYLKDVMEPVMAEGPADPTRTNPPDREYSYELYDVSGGS